MTHTAAPVEEEVDVLDLTFAKEVVTDCRDAITEYDGVLLTPDKSEAAERNKRLLNLADRLDLASALVRNAYWQSRGEASYEL